MGLFEKILKRSQKGSIPRHQKRKVYEPMKRYTPEEFVVYE